MDLQLAARYKIVAGDSFTLPMPGKEPNARRVESTPRFQAAVDQRNHEGIATSAFAQLD